MVYNKPYSKTNHEAITADVPVMGVVENGRVEFLNKEDLSRPVPGSSKK